VSTPTPTTLVRSFGWRGVPVPVLLATSLACNVTALLVPFMEIDIALQARQVYSLPRSVKLMWEHDLHLIALLILAFSIVFPLAKLGTLCVVWFLSRGPAVRRRLLAIVEPLGKWSFMDIFVVTIILVLTDDQLFVGARTIAGVYYFIAAIALSMVTTLIIQRLADPLPCDVAGTSRRHTLLARRGWLRWPTWLVLLAALPALGAAVGVPFIKISQFLLQSNDYSIAAAIPALWSEKAYVIASIVAVTLVAMPAVCFAVLVAMWCWPLRASARRRWGRLAAALWQWAMLDVFGLALLLFLTEGDALIKTEVKPGLSMILVAIVVLTAMHALVTGINRRAAGDAA